MSNRIDKVNELIRSLLGEILTRELCLKPGVFLTIAKVDTSSDLRYTRISLSVFPEKEGRYVEKTLAKEVYAIQGSLNKKLAMKPLPKIQFKIDLTEAKADEIEKLLKQI